MFAGLPETAGAVQISQEGEGVADDPLGGVDHPLELLRFCNHAAAKPHADVACEDALDGAPVDGHQQFLC